MTRGKPLPTKQELVNIILKVKPMKITVAGYIASAVLARMKEAEGF